MVVSKKHQQSFRSFLKSSGFWRFYSPTAYQYWKKAIKDLPKAFQPSGRTLDIGAGQAAYQSDLGLKNIYFSCDISVSEGNNPVISDALELPFSAGAFDSAVSFQVLEHLNNPGKGLDELHRVVKPKGLIIMTVPHISRLHDLPNDFFRFTEYGLQHLLEEASMKIILIQPVGGLIAFLGHQISLVLAMHIAQLGTFRLPLFYLLKYLFVLPTSFLDSLLSTKKYFPHGYIIVAEN
jgi:SAM-dependent methyltransferase